MIKIVIIGLRLESLIAAWVLRQHPHLDVWLVCERPPGMMFTNGDRGQQCLVTHSESMGNLLRELKIIYSTFTPQDGILMRGKIADFPRGLVGLQAEYADRVVRDAHSKAGESMISLASALKSKRKKPRRLRCATDELVSSLSKQARVLVSPTWQLDPGVVFVSGQRRFEYDFAIVTDPISTLRQHAWFDLAPPETVHRTIAHLTPRRLSPFRKWDVVLTPYTPADSAYRVAMNGAEAVVEMRGEVDTKTMLSELNFLFPDGYALKSLDVERSCVAKEQSRWPENIVPLGSLAEGRAYVALDEVLDGAYSLMRRFAKR